MLKIFPLKKWKVTFADGSYVVVDARTNWEAVKVAKPMSRFTTVHAAPVIGWNRKIMRKNIVLVTKEQQQLFRKHGVSVRKYMGDDQYSWAVFLRGRPVITGLHRSEVDYYKRQVLKKQMGTLEENISITPEMVKRAKGEGSKLLERLSKIDRNSSEARKIRRQLRKLGISLSKAVSKEHLRKKVAEGERRRYIKKSIETPLMTKRERGRILHPVRKISTKLEERKHDQVLDTAEVLVKKVGYKSKPELVKRLMEIYPRLTEERARGIADQALFQKNPRKKIKRILNPDYLALSAKEFRKLKRQDPGYKYGKYVTEEEFEKLTRRNILTRNPPAGATEIYGKIIAIEAQKGPNSTFPKENFRHEFKPGSKIFGLPDGSILIKGKKKLWKKFKY